MPQFIYVSDDYNLNDEPTCYYVPSWEGTTVRKLGRISSELSAHGYTRILDNRYCELHEATVGDGFYWFNSETESTIYVWVDDCPLSDLHATATTAVARLLSHH